MTWCVYSDGSALTIDGQHPPFVGGWAAVIEHESEGFVVRGRERKTTNMKMELRAAIEGLRATPPFANVTLYTDCSTILIVKERHVRNQLPSERNCVRDQRLWLELAHEFEMRIVKIKTIPRGGHHIHLRAHTIAKAEARAVERGLDPRAEVIELPTRKQRQKWFVDQDPLIREERRLADQRRRLLPRHRPDCTVGACVSSCDVWLAKGPGGAYRNQAPETQAALRQRASDQFQRLFEEDAAQEGAA